MLKSLIKPIVTLGTAFAVLTGCAGSSTDKIPLRSRGGSNHEKANAKDIIEYNNCGRQKGLNLEKVMEKFINLGSAPARVYVSDVSLIDNSRAADSESITRSSDETAQIAFLLQTKLFVEAGTAGSVADTDVVSFLASARQELKNCNFVKMTRNNIDYRIAQGTKKNEIQISGGVQGFEQLNIEILSGQNTMVVDVFSPNITVCGQNDFNSYVRYIVEWNVESDSEMQMSGPLVNLIQGNFNIEDVELSEVSERARKKPKGRAATIPAASYEMLKAAVDGASPSCGAQ